MKSVIPLMTPKMMTAYLDDNLTVRQALEKFDVHRFTVVPLIDEDGKYSGTLSEGDLLRYFKHTGNFDIKKTELDRVHEIPKHRPYVAIKNDATFSEVLSLSLEQNFIPVIDDSGVYMGIIKRKAVIQRLVEDPISKH